jgi:hypothetical protein
VREAAARRGRRVAPQAPPTKKVSVRPGSTRIAPVGAGLAWEVLVRRGPARIAPVGAGQKTLRRALSEIARCPPNVRGQNRPVQ